jgi:hypothetical protein
VVLSFYVIMMLTVCGCRGVARANREYPAKVHALHAEVHLHTNTRIDCVSSRIPSVVYHIRSYDRQRLVAPFVPDAAKFWKNHSALFVPGV